MRFPTLSAAAFLMLLMLAATETEAVAPTAAETPSNVAVNFIKPDKFTDATYENRISSREQVTRDLAAYLGDLGRRYLPADQQLEIDITDVDLAGRYEPWNVQAADVRFMRDVTWPRIGLKYRLLEGGAEIAKGEESISDMNYLTRIGLRSTSDRLRYEKSMLDEWFRGRFDPASKQPAAK